MLRARFYLTRPQVGWCVRQTPGHVDLRTVAARYRLGELSGEELPDIAIALMNDGFDSQALRELAGLDRPTHRDADELFERVLEERGVVVPDQRSAQRLMLEYLLESIVRGDVDPGDGAYNVWGLVGDLFNSRELDQWAIFAGLASEFEDHPGAREELAAQIIGLARATLGRLREAPV